MKRFFPALLLPALLLGGCKKDKEEEPVYEGVVINGITWSEYNVDAPGTFTTQPEDFGMFYQWNRKKGWPTTGRITGWVVDPATGNEWAADNDPCPEGWRVPTKDEQATLLDDTKVTKEWVSKYGVYGNGRRFTDNSSGNSVFLPAADYRHDEGGQLTHIGVSGTYWSSSTNSVDDVWILNFISNYALQFDENSRTYGFSVRCVRK